MKRVVARARVNGSHLAWYLNLTEAASLVRPIISPSAGRGRDQEGVSVREDWARKPHYEHRCILFVRSCVKKREALLGRDPSA